MGNGSSIRTWNPLIRKPTTPRPASQPCMNWSAPYRRRDDPQRNSEAEVYELEAAPEAPALDFCAWFKDRACFGVQVKGGR